MGRIGEPERRPLTRLAGVTMTRLIGLIDGSGYAQSVCDHAAWVAGRTDASVEVVHVLGRRDVSSNVIDFSGGLNIDVRGTFLAEVANLDAQKAKLAYERGHLILEDAKARLQAAGVADVAVSLRQGDLIDIAQSLEAEADLILIGKRGEGADFARLHLGSNLERIVRAVSKPVLVASRAFRPVSRFLIAFDGGPSAMKAVSHIAAGSLFAGLACRILSVGPETAEGRLGLERAASVLRDRGYDVTADIVAGQPETAISRMVETEGIDLLVMGAYGHSRIRRLIIGSTTAEMIRSCLIPVMLFR